MELADGAYIRKLCEGYPEVKRLLFLYICEMAGLGEAVRAYMLAEYTAKL